MIGNPPYDVLSEKEQNRDLSAFKEYILKTPIFDPPRRKTEQSIQALPMQDA